MSQGKRKVLQFEAAAIKDFLKGFPWFLTLFSWYGKLTRVSKEDRALPKLPIGWIQETKSGVYFFGFLLKTI